MLGMGKKRPSGSPDEAERTLFRELGDKQDQGGRRSRRRLWLVLTTVAAVGVLAAAVPLVANAVLGTDGPTLFELDGNIVDNSGTPNLPQDWSDFQQAPGNGDGPVARTFITDGFNGNNDTIFFGGGSQNNNDIPSWAWSCGSVSTKSDIEHAFAAAYLKNNNLYVYFGADRYDPTGGTTNVGFWFLQGGGALTGGTGCPDLDKEANAFSGAHVNGDIFVFAEFAGGGGDSAISIFEWKNGALSLLFVKTAANFCNPSDTICGTTNTGLIDVPWTYSDNQGTAAGKITTGGFFEGGINLSALYQGLGKDLPCVNQFLAITGSSHPDTGVLEDFAGGSFNLCSKLIVDKVTSPPGDTTKFPFTITGPNAYSQSPQLADGDAPFDSGLVKSGTYSVTETNPNSTFWQLTSVACVDGGGNTVAYNSANGQVNIGPGQTVTCTFTNTFQKQTPPVATDIHAGAGANDQPGAAAILSAAIGSTVHDKATVSGVARSAHPDGHGLLYGLSRVTNCSGSGTAAGTNVALVAGVAHPSGDVVVPAGGLSFKAHYNGDTKYNAADGPCEPLTGNRLSSSTVTDIHAGADANDAAGAAAILSAAIGSTVHDKATVSGALTTPTGTVNFTVYAERD